MSVTWDGELRTPQNPKRNREPEIQENRKRKFKKKHSEFTICAASERINHSKSKPNWRKTIEQQRCNVLALRKPISKHTADPPQIYNRTNGTNFENTCVKLFRSGTKKPQIQTNHVSTSEPKTSPKRKQTDGNGKMLESIGCCLLSLSIWEPQTHPISYLNENAGNGKQKHGKSTLRCP